MKYLKSTSFSQHNVNVNETTVPAQIRCSADRIKEDGVYLLGETILKSFYGAPNSKVVNHAVKYLQTLNYRDYYCYRNKVYTAENAKVATILLASSSNLLQQAHTRTACGSLLATCPLNIVSRRVASWLSIVIIHMHAVSCSQVETSLILTNSLNEINKAVATC